MNEDDSLARLNAIGVLTRREIEARLLGPLIEALSEKFGRAEVLDTVRAAIIQIAEQQGRELAAGLGGCDLLRFAASLEAWKKDGALQIEVLEQSPTRFAFNVVRCRYAELYASLGLKDAGAVLSCNRDAALIGGFNPQVRFERTQTIMQGAPHCDFRYTLDDEGS